MKFLVIACVLGFALGAMDNAKLLEDLFTLVDTERNGDFSKAELTEVYNSYDTHKDGRVTEHEFYLVLCARTPDLCPMGKALYRQFDVNKAHLITTSDLDTLYSHFDADGNGSVSKTEFTTFMATAIATAKIHSVKHHH